MYSLEYHNSCLSNMCRICGQRAQTFAQIRKKISPVMCKNNQDEIYIFYGIDVANENENLFPKKMCSKCYIAVKHTKVKSESPKMDISVFKGKKEMTDKVTKIFQPHRRIGCKVCQIYNEQKNLEEKQLQRLAVPVKKNKILGILKLLIFFPTFSVTHQFSMYQILKFMGSLKHRKKHSFVKFVWIFSQNNQLEHSAIITFVYSVSHKLSNANKTDYIMCRECQSIVHFTDIKIAEERFQQQIAYLDVQCIKCQKVGPLCTFTLHFCQSDLPHEFPSQCSLDLVTSAPKKKHQHLPFQDLKLIWNSNFSNSCPKCNT